MKSLSHLYKLTDKFLTLLKMSRKPSGGPFDVLLHGDYYMWNVALSEGQEPKIFDFEYMCFGSFAYDLQEFLAQTVKTPERVQHLPTFLDAYREGFASACDNKDVLEKWTEENIKKEYKRLAPVGLVYGLHFIPPRFIAKDKLDMAIKESTSPEECVKLMDEKDLDAIQDTMTLVDECLSFGAIETIETLLKNI